MRYVIVELDDFSAVVAVEKTTLVRGGISNENTEHTYFKKIASFSSVGDAVLLLKSEVDAHD